jgi:hypothetical protein
MTSAILPFTSMNKFSNTAMAQEMGYYDDDNEYGDYNSDISYDRHDDETYSDYQDKENKYECRTGPFEGFFVSSPEFCKNVKLDDDKDDRKKDDSRDNKKTGTPSPVVPPPSQNVTLDAIFPELRLIADPNELVILDGSGSTGNITSWSIVQTGGQPSVTLQDVPSKQYSKQFTMPNTNDTLVFDLTVTNNQTGQQDTATALVVSNQTLALLACSGVIPPPTDYQTFSNPDDNYIIPYPKEFSLEPGNSFIPSDPPDLGNATTFNYTIPRDPSCQSDIVGEFLKVNILQATYGGQTSAQLEDFILNESLGRTLLDILENKNLIKPVYIHVNPSKPTIGTWKTFQGNTGTFLDFTITRVNTGIDPPIGVDHHYRVFYVIIDNLIYFLSYSVTIIHDPPPHYFDIYYINKVKNMVDSICFPSQANKQCPSTFPTTPLNPPPGPIVTEEWRNYDYKEIPGIPDFYKVFITCINQQGGTCLDQPGKITFVQPFAGFNCIANPAGCDLGKLKVDANNLIIHSPPRTDASGTKLWTAISVAPHVWILDRLGINCIFNNCGVVGNAGPNVKFTAQDVLTGGKKLEGKFLLQLFQTTRCDGNNKNCQVIPGPAFNIKGPYTVVGPEVRTGINVKQGNVINIHASGKVDFGGAFLGIGAPILDANGDSEPTPSDFPRDELRKNSLIVNIGNGWYQGGTDTSFTSTTSGEIILRANDADTTDNSRGWSVSVTVR